MSTARTLATGWDHLADAGRVGPLDPRTRRLVALAVAIGARCEREAAACAQDALAHGELADALDQVVALAAPVIGRPAADAARDWVAGSTPDTADNAKPEA
jgi:AhpD family alkylhydroperoxidase